MSERTVEEIHSEITAERQRLNDDLTALRSEIRSLGLLVAAGFVVVALVTWREGSRQGVEAIWKLIPSFPTQSRAVGWSRPLPRSLRANGWPTLPQFADVVATLAHSGKRRRCRSLHACQLRERRVRRGGMLLEVRPPRRVAKR